jgi:hypothetical protein
MIEPSRVCPRCRERKPFSAFYPRTRWPEGTVRTVAAYCRPCNAAKRREWARAHPGAHAQAMRRYRKKLAQDPARLAAYQEGRRFHARDAAQREGSQVGRMTDIGPPPLLPALPFVEWLREYPTIAAASAATLLPPRRLSELRRGAHRHVRFDTVDRACINAGMPLDLLYPLP